MNGAEQRTHRTTTQALERRIDDAEAVILRLMHNNDVLIKSCASLEERVPLLADRIAALTEELAALSQEPASYWQRFFGWLAHGWA